MTTQDAAQDSGRTGLKRDDVQRTTAVVRLAIGLAQGVVMWWLFHASGGSDGQPKTWPATDPLIFAPIFLVTTYMAVVMLGAVGRLRLRTLLIWSGTAAVVLAVLAWHDMARRTLEASDSFPSPGLMAFAAAALFIAHHLIVPADRQRRRIADYHGYFDAAWMAGVQLVLSLAFTGAFWLLLYLGAALFRVIGLKFLGDLIGEPAFAFPVTGLVFATAVQLTDVRDGLIRGVRTVALMLLSWLLLVLTVLVAGFLAALPFTGLEGLWKTGSATALVLSAAGILIVLINTAYQDGREDNLPPAVLRAAVRVASILLTPLILIAVWGLSLRIGQHGLTPERIIACACALVGALYAAGYGLGALVPFVRRGSAWMKALEPTNIAAAILSVAVILALFSPLADPARMSVKDQMARLERGAVAPADFDYAFLRFESGKVGERALDRLTVSSTPAIRYRAAQSKAATDPWELRGEHNHPVPTRTPSAIVINTDPEDKLPATFTGQYEILMKILGHCDSASPCFARHLDLDEDGTPEILVASHYSISAFKLEADGRWIEWAEYSSPSCRGEFSVRDSLRQKAATPVQPTFPDLIVGDVRLRTQIGEPECPAPMSR